MDFKLALEAAQKACEMARSIQLEMFGGALKVSDKGLEGLVSEADVLSERAIEDILKKYFPTIEVFGEEGQAKQKSDLEKTSWIVDPLDGTTNFIYGLPIYCVSIGLQINGEVVLGVVDVPHWNRTYHAVKNEGAFLNGEPIRVAKRTQLSECVLATGFQPGSRDFLNRQIQIFAKLVEKSRAVRRPGAAALDLCLVAEGVFDAFWEMNLKPWDTAAGSLLVREAGGVVRNYQGEDFHVLDKSIVAASPSIYSQIQHDLT